MKRYRIVRLTIILFFTFLHVLGKTQTLDQLEDTLIKYRNRVLKANSDEERSLHNQEFIKHLESTLKVDEVFEFPFEKLNSMCTLTSPDQRFRLFNWNVAKSDFTHDFFCYVLTNDGKLTRLKRLEAIPQKLEFKTFDQNNWLGALYYKIILLKRNGKRFYTLLGWDGNNKTVTKKYVDVMSFSGKKIKFGASLFKMEKKTQKRVVFKFSSEITMSLKYEKKGKRIVFDHLAPVNENLKGIFDFYGPNMTYDALEMKGGKWVYRKDAEIKGNPNEKNKPYQAPN